MNSNLTIFLNRPVNTNTLPIESSYFNLLPQGVPSTGEAPAEPNLPTDRSQT